MNVYNPLDSMRRLEASGLDRRQAEAIASEISDSKNDLVTNETFEIKLNAAIDRQTIRLGGFLGGMIALAVAILGTLISIK